MAISLIGPLNKVINETAAEILDSKVIDKMTDIMGAFMTSGIEVIKGVTEEEASEEPE
jgi:hypothetical protein